MIVGPLNTSPTSACPDESMTVTFSRFDLARRLDVTSLSVQ